LAGQCDLPGSKFGVRSSRLVRRGREASAFTIMGDHPAIFVRVDGHIAIANSAALKAGGITRETPDPPGGKIDRDAGGEATGILRETSKDALLAIIPPPSPAQRRRAIELALADAAQWGVTSAQDNSGWEDFLVYEQLEREGKLTLRITEWLPFSESLAVLKQRRAAHPADDLMLHTGMLKGFMDGSLGSRTAAMLAPLPRWASTTRPRAAAAPAARSSSSIR